MIKRVIYTQTGQQIEVEIEGQFWDFKTDDVIIDDYGDGNERFSVQGFRDGKLWAYSGKTKYAKPFVVPFGMLLIERPGLKYKVGDIVKITRGLGMGSIGIIAVIDPLAAEKELNNKPAYPYYVEIDFPDNDGYNIKRKENCWYPKKGGNKQRIMCSEHEIEKWDESREQSEEKEVASPAEEGGLAMTEKKWPDSLEIGEGAPEWIKEMSLKIKAGVSHFFILWGNIHDLQKVGDKFISIEQCLTDILGQDGKTPAVFYSISKGLYFHNSGAETRFRERHLGQVAETAKNQTASQSEADKIAAAGKRAQQEAPLSEIIGKGPDKVFPFLEKFVLSEKSGPKILIIDFGHNVAPAETGAQDRLDRETIEALEYWARDGKIREAGGAIILLTPHLVDIADGLRSPHSGITAIKVPKPNEEARAERWKTLVESGETEVKDKLNAQTLGRIPN
ncbi:MAG: hypothetical protein AAB851_00395, partial [Patescibacteria group bacterium]